MFRIASWRCPQDKTRPYQVTSGTQTQTRKHTTNTHTQAPTHTHKQTLERCCTNTAMRTDRLAHAHTANNQHTHTHQRQGQQHSTCQYISLRTNAFTYVRIRHQNAWPQTKHKHKCWEVCDIAKHAASLPAVPKRRAAVLALTLTLYYYYYYRYHYHYHYHYYYNYYYHYYYNYYYGSKTAIQSMGNASGGRAFWQ